MSASDWLGYPTAMALIRKPDWKNTFVTTRIADFQPDTLGIANVEFEFPEHVRFPTMPVRTDNGLVFTITPSSIVRALTMSRTFRCSSPIIGGLRNGGTGRLIAKPTLTMVG